MVVKFSSKKRKEEFDGSIMLCFKPNLEEVHKKLIERHNNKRILRDNEDYANKFLEEMVKQVFMAVVDRGTEVTLSARSQSENTNTSSVIEETPPA